MNGKSIWYDYVEGDALTVDKLEDLVEQLGYEVQGRLHSVFLNSVFLLLSTFSSVLF